MLYFLEATLKDFIETMGGLKKIESISTIELDHHFNMMLSFSFTWGIGGALYDTTLDPMKTKFNNILKAKLQHIYP
jgi:hypothetical protein